MYRHIHINPRALQSIGIARRMNNKLARDINSMRARCDRSLPNECSNSRVYESFCDASFYSITRGLAFRFSNVFFISWISEVRLIALHVPETIAQNCRSLHVCICQTHTVSSVCKRLLRMMW